MSQYISKCESDSMCFQQGGVPVGAISKYCENQCQVTSVPVHWSQNWRTLIQTFNMENNIRQIRQVFKSLQLQNGRGSESREMSRKSSRAHSRRVEVSTKFRGSFHNTQRKLLPPTRFLSVKELVCAFDKEKAQVGFFSKFCEITLTPLNPGEARWMFWRRNCWKLTVTKCFLRRRKRSLRCGPSPWVWRAPPRSCTRCPGRGRARTSDLTRRRWAAAALVIVSPCPVSVLAVRVFVTLRTGNANQSEKLRWPKWMLHWYRHIAIVLGSIVIWKTRYPGQYS